MISNPLKTPYKSPPISLNCLIIGNFATALASAVTNFIAILTIINRIRKTPPVNVKDKNVMFRIIKCAFMQRRKTLLNSLTNTKVFLNKDEGIKILNKLNLSENIRPEKLSLQDFANITNEFLKE